VKCFADNEYRFSIYLVLKPEFFWEFWLFYFHTGGHLYYTHYKHYAIEHIKRTGKPERFSVKGIEILQNA